MSQRTTFTKWGFLQCSLFVKLLPLRHDACKCHCTHIARLQAAGRTYCWHGVKPEETCLICPPLSLTLSFSSIALFYCFHPYPICPCQHGCYSVRLRRGSSGTDSKYCGPSNGFYFVFVLSGLSFYLFSSLTNNSRSKVTSDI